MKPKLITAILLFISAYAPLFLILIIKDFDFVCLKLRHPIHSFVLLGVILVSILLLILTTKLIRKGNMAIKVKTINFKSFDIINYCFPYLFCAFDVDLSKPEDILTITILLSMLLVLTIRMQALFINPILVFAGYLFYDIEYEYNGASKNTTLISNKKLKDGSIYYVRSLTPFLYFVTKEKNEIN